MTNAVQVDAKRNMLKANKLSIPTDTRQRFARKVPQNSPKIKESLTKMRSRICPQTSPLLRHKIVLTREVAFRIWTRPRPLHGTSVSLSNSCPGVPTIINNWGIVNMGWANISASHSWPYDWRKWEWINASVLGEQMHAADRWSSEMHYSAAFLDQAWLTFGSVWHLTMRT